MPERAFGLFDHLERRDEPLADTYEGRLQLLAAADQAGFYAYHLAEHHQTRLGMAPSPTAFLAALAQRTTNLRFGPLVYLLPLYHPLRLIDEICMLDNLSKGRFQVGVGRGVSPFEVAYYDIPFLRSKEMYLEMLEIVMHGLRDERLTFRGRHYDLVDVPMELRPFQQPNPPFWIGVGNLPNMQFAAERGMNWVTSGSSEFVKSAVEPYPALREQHRGNPLDANPEIAEPVIGAYRHIFVADNDADASAIATPAFSRYYDNITSLWRSFGTQPIRFTGDLDLAQEREVAIVGSPKTVRERVETFFRDTGCNYLVLSFAWGGLTQEQSMQSLQLFSSEVMPEFVAT